MNNIWLVPVSVIEALPNSVMTLLEETNGFHAEDSTKEEGLRVKFDYISLLLGFETPEAFEDKHECSPFFAQIKDLKALYNVFGKYKQESEKQLIFTLPKQASHIFVRNSICF